MDLVASFGESSYSATIAKQIGDAARKRAIVGGNVSQVLEKERLVSSKVLHLVYPE